jgi:hypothetical protein
VEQVRTDVRRRDPAKLYWQEVRIFDLALHLDEVFVKANGALHYLCGAADQLGG